MAQITYPLIIKKKIKECDNACSLVLTPKNLEDQKLFLYKPAQFLSFHIEVDGKKVMRSYSISSCPLTREDLTTSIKKLPYGKASSYLVDEIKENDIIYSSRPQGRFFKIPDSLKPRHYLMVAGGSGITPLFSILKTVLLSDKQNQVTLVYCNKNENSIIYKNPLKEWEKRYSDRFQVIHFISRPVTHEYENQGRLTEKTFTHIVNTCNTKQLDMESYLCGPTELMKMIETILLESIDKKMIRKESFGVVQKKKPAHAPTSALIISADGSSHSSGETVESIHARLDGEKIEISAEPDVSILDQLIDAGHAPPFSCMEGNCMTCMAVLKKGKVYQDEPGILVEENIEAKEILTCQAKPLTRTVEVDYE